MPASPNDPRTKRRKAAGDDPNKMSMAPQPVPGAPQGQGNMMNYPMMQTPSGEMGQQIGAGAAVIRRFAQSAMSKAEVDRTLSAIGKSEWQKVRADPTAQAASA